MTAFSFPHSTDPSSPQKASSGLSRRRLLTAGLASAAASRASAQKSVQAKGKFSAPTAHKFDERLVALVNRVTQGFTLEEYALAQELGYEGYLEYHLDPGSIDDSAFEPSIAHFETLGWTADELQNVIQEDTSTAPNPQLELQAMTTMRSVNSKRQLFERMVEFWTDHFNMDINKGLCRLTKTTDDRDVTRPFALATFPELLSASAHSPCMLYYLDNWANIVGVAQENYAREIMELHSLGVAGGYTEADVKEVARCFTGWQLKHPNVPDFGTFFYSAASHDEGEKLVLGQVIPAGGGIQDGELVVEILSEHPSTAQFIATKLTRWLLVHEPAQELIDQVAAKYTATGGDIKAMVRTILRRASLEAAQPWKNPKLKRPFHFVTSLLRAVGATMEDGGVIDNHSFLMIELEKLGQRPFTWPSPDGHPDTISAWGSSLLPRWQFANRLMANGITAVSVDMAQVASTLNELGPGSMAQRISRMLTGGTMSFTDVSRVQAYLDAQATISPGALGEAIALAASTPSFQYY